MTKVKTMVLNKEIVTNKVICNLMGVLSFVVLTALGGYIRIPLPFTPVPITLQTFFVILAGALLGGRLGTLSQIGYLSLGAAGLPIFQSYGSGLAHITGPTGGYLLGFLIAPAVVAKLISKKRERATFAWVTFSMLIGSLIILTLGSIHLANFMHIRLEKAIVLGMLCFLPGDFVKIAFASSIYMGLKKRINKIFGLCE